MPATLLCIVASAERMGPRGPLPELLAAIIESNRGVSPAGGWLCSLQMLVAKPNMQVFVPMKLVIEGLKRESVD